jgi:hypothetical protein
VIVFTSTTSIALNMHACLSLRQATLCRMRGISSWRLDYVTGVLSTSMGSSSACSMHASSASPWHHTHSRRASSAVMSPSWTLWLQHLQLKPGAMSSTSLPSSSPPSEDETSTHGMPASEDVTSTHGVPAPLSLSWPTGGTWIAGGAVASGACAGAPPLPLRKLSLALAPYICWAALPQAGIMHQPDRLSL